MTPYEETLANQRLAADPERSAFVMANAGAGKTRVLIERVARLLLKDTDPAKILCITFTKAAAAEMAERLFEVLGGWSLLDDEKLTAALTKLRGRKDPGDDLSAVRRLFARALETPGGLKIQTIHSFCESVLKRFPLEAGVAPGFSVLDDKEAPGLAATALDETASASARDAPLGSAFARLTVQKNEADLRKYFTGALTARASFEDAFTRFGGIDGLLNAIAMELGADRTQCEDELRQGFFEILDGADLQRAHDALAQSGGNPFRYCAEPIAIYQNASTPEQKWAALTKLFYKTDGAPRSKFGTKATEKIDPWVEPYLVEQQQRFAHAHEALKATAIFHDTAAFLAILDDVLRRYSRKKAARAALDYDDLIIRTQALFTKTSAEWIMFKLDNGLDHVLIDEAQDTSPGQWDVIDGPLREFFSGEGAREVARTFFAVGDKKQSIYSFQGADVDLFAEKEQTLGKRIAAVSPYENVPLTLSFRTTAPVLAFVDALFADRQAAAGLGEGATLEHGVHRTGEAGLVELWPLTPKPERAPPTPWDAPVDAEPPINPVRMLSEEIAAKIDGWLTSGEVLASKGRPIEPGDIMILVQTRRRLFDEVIRTLARRGVSVAGADKLKLLEDAAIEDLLSYARFALTPTDDLSLAEILKSPFFGVDEDALFDLAYNRGGHSLWGKLNVQAREDDHWRGVADELTNARAAGLREGPFAFFSHILETGAPSGRRRLYERLGPAARDSIDELLRQALAYEQSAPRDIRGFIAWFEANAGEIKREMDRTNDAVRVMTVHGAKGLESEIVFLIDSHQGPNLRHLGPLLTLARTPDAPERPAGIMAFAASKTHDCAATAAARELAKVKEYEEYRRRLYVAATRARDRLYICGVQAGNTADPCAKPVNEQSWHALASSAFDGFGEAVETVGALWGEPIRRLSSRQDKPPGETDADATPDYVPSPDWLFAHAQPEKLGRRLAPSRLTDEAEQGAEVTVDAAYSPGAANRYARGRVLHRLLELLPDIETEKRANAADRLLARLTKDASPATRDQWRDEVLTVLNHPEFAPVFAPGSRAEVAIAGTPKGVRNTVVISGQIDRLAISNRRILVVDYKTNRPPPAHIKDAEPAYIAQMAAYRALLEEIYPDHQIEAALLWTFDAKLMVIPGAMLDHAFARYLAPG